MEKLLNWAILNTATKGEDAPEQPDSADKNLVPKKFDPEILNMILGKPLSTQMLESMEYIENEEISVENREIEFENLEMFVEQIDAAAGPLGLWPRLLKFLDNENEGLRFGTLWVMATALQHNPAAQKRFGEDNGLEKLLDHLSKEQSERVKTKTIYAISSYVRNNNAGFVQFVNHKGVNTLVELIGSTASKSSSTEISKKVLFLLFALINESQDAIIPKEARPPTEFPLALCELGLYSKIKTLLLSVVSITSLPESNTDQIGYDSGLLDNCLNLILLLAKIPECNEYIKNVNKNDREGINFISELKKKSEELVGIDLSESDWEVLSSVF
ncbi:Hsp70 nucleotide exchange factor fes1 [Zancudomyces culisetae]|uniref:Hsp70 nucleotide exchange factor fes1 n=1 Tax=Zancudomyces culisetae TaxID=1213189 RepID=A0A1R1PUP3_ZANCU|nr:Hsp70 nucleotide exchange factor fes1 [Zancudomyces culisetae]|eukprot:OMH84633.1 Hsp70 nucleotide exchange factor fes1 [Zancudomyces culisetae]